MEDTIAAFFWIGRGTIEEASVESSGKTVQILTPVPTESKRKRATLNDIYAMAVHT